MPYVVRKRSGKWCVYKKSGGSSLGCHDSKAKAERQIRAIEANEGSSSAGGISVNAMNPLWQYLGTSTDGSATTNGGTFTFDFSESEVEEEAERGSAFETILCVVGHPTSDGRFLIPDEISHRDLPIPFLVQTETQPHHFTAEVCGRIESITFIPADKFKQEGFDLGEVTDGSVVVFANGTFDSSQHGEDAVRMIENGAGVSIDLPPERVAFFDPDTLEEILNEDVDWEKAFNGEYLLGIGGKIAAATIVSIPAFEEAEIMLSNVHALIASAYDVRLPKTMTASAAGLAPLKPPTAWFYMDEPNEPTPLTITKDGQVYGHLALWNQCHAAFASCESPPRSASEYSYFHVGQIETDEGDMVNVGRITVGEAGRAKGGHASLILGRQGAMEHYDETGCVGAFVRAKDGVHGIWLSGAVRSDAPSERVRDMRANPPSGDWRDYELVAVLSVPVPGFPVARAAEARMVASASGEEEVAALIATSYTAATVEISPDEDEGGLSMTSRWTLPDEGISEPIDIPTYRRRMSELSERRRDLLDGAA